MLFLLLNCLEEPKTHDEAVNLLIATYASSSGSLGDFYGFSEDDARVFMNLHSFIIVVVGTFGVLFLSSTKIGISDLLKSVTSLVKRENPDQQ